METRRLSATEKVTITLPEELYKAIENYIKQQHEYTNIPDFLSCACKYFCLRFAYDIEPQINEKITEYAHKKQIVEKISFVSEYSGESVSKQSTMASGIISNMHSLVSTYPHLDYSNILRYSPEFYYNSIMKSRDITAVRYMEKYYDKKDVKEDFTPPVVRFECQTRDGS